MQGSMNVRKGVRGVRKGTAVAVALALGYVSATATLGPVEAVGALAAVGPFALTLASAFALQPTPVISLPAVVDMSQQAQVQRAMLKIQAEDPLLDLVFSSFLTISFSDEPSPVIFTHSARPFLYTIFPSALFKIADLNTALRLEMNGRVVDTLQFIPELPEVIEGLRKRIVKMPLGLLNMGDAYHFQKFMETQDAVKASRELVAISRAGRDVCWPEVNEFLNARMRKLLEAISSPEYERLWETRDLAKQRVMDLFSDPYLDAIAQRIMGENYKDRIKFLYNKHLTSLEDLRLKSSELPDPPIFLHRAVTHSELPVVLDYWTLAEVSRGDRVHSELLDVLGRGFAAYIYQPQARVLRDLFERMLSQLSSDFPSDDRLRPLREALLRTPYDLGLVFRALIHVPSSIREGALKPLVDYFNGHLRFINEPEKSSYLKWGVGFLTAAVLGVSAFFMWPKKTAKTKLPLSLREELSKGQTQEDAAQPKKSNSRRGLSVNKRADQPEREEKITEEAAKAARATEVERKRKEELKQVKDQKTTENQEKLDTLNAMFLGLKERLDRNALTPTAKKELDTLFRDFESFQRERQSFEEFYKIKRELCRVLEQRICALVGELESPEESSANPAVEAAVAALSVSARRFTVSEGPAGAGGPGAASGVVGVPEGQKKTNPYASATPLYLASEKSKEVVGAVQQVGVLPPDDLILAMSAHLDEEKTVPLAIKSGNDALVCIEQFYVGLIQFFQKYPYTPTDGLSDSEKPARHLVAHHQCALERAQSGVLMHLFQDVAKTSEDSFRGYFKELQSKPSPIELLNMINRRMILLNHFYSKHGLERSDRSLYAVLGVLRDISSIFTENAVPMITSDKNTLLMSKMKMARNTLSHLTRVESSSGGLQLGFSGLSQVELLTLAQALTAPTGMHRNIWNACPPLSAEEQSHWSRVLPSLTAELSLVA